MKLFKTLAAATALTVASFIAAPTADAISPIDQKYNSSAALKATLGSEQGSEYSIGAPYPGSEFATVQDYQHGLIWYNEDRGAHWMNDPIGDLWKTNAYPELYLPTGDQHSVVGGQAVNTDGGDIYWSSSTGAHIVYDGLYGLNQAIDTKYDALGGPGGLLGLPTQDMHGFEDDGVVIGIGQRFKWGMIFQKGEDSGIAHEVHGAILTRYFQLDCIRGDLGWPTSDEQSAPGGRVSYFENGSITWNASTGKTSVIIDHV